jgi:acyl-CoA synthetase (AMP-forming)/AMP-acid ligase II
VAEAAAFPVIIDGYRQIPVAAVVLRAAASPEDLIAFCRDRLGARAPRRIHILAAQPHNAIGKVLKRELARQLSAFTPSPRA